MSIELEFYGCAVVVKYLFVNPNSQNGSTLTNFGKSSFNVVSNFSKSLSFHHLSLIQVHK